MEPVTPVAKARWRASRAVVGCAFILMTLTGCGSAEFASEFHADGSARHTLEISIPTSELSEADAARISSFFTKIDQQSADNGLDVVRFQSGPLLVFRVSREVENAEDVGAALNGLLNASGLNSSPGITAPFSGVFRQESRPVGGRAYELNLTANGDELFEAITQETGATADPSWPADLRESFRVQYVATMPGRVTETNGMEADDGELIWDMPLTGVTTMTARSTLSSGGGATAFVVIAIAAGVVIAGFGLWLGLRVYRWRWARQLRDAEVEAERGRSSVMGLWVAGRAERVAVLLHTGRQANGASGEERVDDGPHTEGDGPAAGLHGGGTGSEAHGARLEAEPSGSRRVDH
jgi:hypothetical protein